MKPILALLLVAVAVTSYAAGASRRSAPPRYSGDELVAQLIGEPGVPKSKQSLDTLFKQRYAEGYLDGVVDASEGRTWCAPAYFHGREVDDPVFNKLKKRARGTMPGNAAHVLLEQYNADFPCL